MYGNHRMSVDVDVYPEKEICFSEFITEEEKIEELTKQLNIANRNIERLARIVDTMQVIIQDGIEYTDNQTAYVQSQINKHINRDFHAILITKTKESEDESNIP